MTFELVLQLVIVFRNQEHELSHNDSRNSATSPAVHHVVQLWVTMATSEVLICTNIRLDDSRSGNDQWSRFISAIRIRSRGGHPIALVVFLL